MTEQTDAAEVAALAEIALTAGVSGIAPRYSVAHAVLASDWLSAREAAAEARGAERIGVAVQAWAMKNEIAEPPIDWAWLGEIIRASGAPYETEEASDEA